MLFAGYFALTAFIENHSTLEDRRRRWRRTSSNKRDILECFRVEAEVLTEVEAKMKIIEASAGLLTNFEVLDFLHNKGESSPKDETVSEIKSGDAEAGEEEDNQSDTLKRRLAPSEMKVYDYLINTAARDQTRECVSEFLRRCKKYELVQADILPILNLRPSEPTAAVELYSIVESFYQRYENEEQEIIQMIDEVLPPRPIHKKDKEEFIPLETIDKVKEKISSEPQEDGSHPEPIIEG